MFSDRWNVYNREWDLLVVLDTCRVDALRKVADEYSFLEDVDAKWSVGSTSPEWILNTFNSQYSDEVSKTAYITSNPHTWTVFMNNLDTNPSGKNLRRIDRLKRYKTKSPVDPENFYKLVQLYDDTDDYGTVNFPSPRTVTDHVVDTDRNDDPPRIIAHYMPPHLPYIAKSVNDEIVHMDEPRPVSYEAYLDNLRWVLEEISLLLKNVDRKRVIITADHGENFFLRSIFRGHRPGMVNPKVRMVPWAETSATDSRTYEPDLSEGQEGLSPNETLEALGYV